MLRVRSFFIVNKLLTMGEENGASPKMLLKVVCVITFIDFLCWLGSKTIPEECLCNLSSSLSFISLSSKPAVKPYNY